MRLAAGSKTKAGSARGALEDRFGNFLTVCQRSEAIDGFPRPVEPERARNMIQFLRAGGLAVGTLLAVVGALTSFSGHEERPDVVVLGSVMVDPAVRAVQHPTGGIVAEIRRRNGDHVKSGELLARLDDSAIRTDLRLSDTRLDRLAARRARLEAERDGQSAVNFPPALMVRITDPLVRSAIEEEQRIFMTHASTRQTEADLQQARIRLLDDEIAGLKVQEDARAAEAALVEQELDGVRRLHDQSLVSMPRLNGLKRDAVRLDSERRGAIPVWIAQAKGRITDMQLEMIRSSRESFRDAANELRDVDDKLADLARRRAEFEMQLRGAEILSPQDGVILSSSLPGAGCPIAAGESLMYIAPADERPSVEAKVDQAAARRLKIGQEVKLAVERAGASELAGRLDHIVPAGDGSSGDRYVMLRFALSPEAQADPVQWKPGTAVKVSIPAERERRGLVDLVPAAVRPLLGPMQRASL